MKGLEIARSFWEEYGRPMLTDRFPELMPLLAAGLVGAGSECYGYDDEVSRDHDYTHGFCIYLPDEDRVSRRDEFLLGRAYESLPKEYMGLRRSLFTPAGGNRHGVFRTAEVYRGMTGIAGTPVGWRAYLSVPDYALAEAINGEVFYDGLGEFTAIREAWSNPPEDVQRKKLCGYLIRMSQTGEYNYPRSLTRNDIATAQLTAAEFVKSAVSAFSWLHNRPAPYYKWCLRSLEDYADGDSLQALLQETLTGEADEAIPEACAEVLAAVKEAFPECAGDADLQHAALTIHEKIRDGVLRSAGPLAAVTLS